MEPTVAGNTLLTMYAEHENTIKMTILQLYKVGNYNIIEFRYILLLLVFRVYPKFVLN